MELACKNIWSLAGGDGCRLDIRRSIGVMSWTGLGRKGTRDVVAIFLAGNFRVLEILLHGSLRGRVEGQWRVDGVKKIMHT